MQIPEALRVPERVDWTDRLPRLLADLMTEWQLSEDGTAMAGNCAIAVPVRTAERVPAVLKVTWPHWEAEYEHLALRHWNGDGAVRLLRADPRRLALLLERADATHELTDVPIPEALEVITGLYPRLHRPATPQFRRLSELSADWADRLMRIRTHPAVPRRLVEQAAGLARDFGTDAATDGTLVHTDLHYHNVLASLRPPSADSVPEPWLVIDPKPLSGDPTYEVAPLLWNRLEEEPQDRLRDAVLDRVYQVVDAMGWDEDRVRDWVIVRQLCNVLWEIEDGGPLGDGWITESITVAKAAQR